MITKTFMIQSLSRLVKKDEDLMFPVFGVLVQGNVQHIGFFGFSGDCLLIALINGNHVTYTSRVPMDVSKVKVKKNLLNREIIDIGFIDGPPCRIILANKVLKLGNQSDNVNAFIQCIKSKAKSTVHTNLNNMDGDKIRWQFFNIIIYTVLLFIPFAIELTFVVGLNKIPFILTETIKNAVGVMGVLIAICLPFVILSILNRNFYGKILCVLNDEGMFFENTFVKWSNIEKIVYHPQLPSKSRLNFNYATIYVKLEEKRKYTFDVLHFPAYGMKKAKQYNNAIKTSFDKGDVLPIVLVELVLVVMPMIFYFIA